MAELTSEQHDLVMEARTDPRIQKQLAFWTRYKEGNGVSTSPLSSCYLLFVTRELTFLHWQLRDSWHLHVGAKKLATWARKLAMIGIIRVIGLLKCLKKNGSHIRHIRENMTPEATRFAEGIGSHDVCVFVSMCVLWLM